MAVNFRNPIVFGVLLGVLLCVLLFIHDKLFKKKEEKNGFSVYFKLFLAGFIVSTPLIWLLFYKSEQKGGSGSGGGGGGGGEIDISDIKEGGSAIKSSMIEKVKGLKRCHADMPDW